MKRFVVSIAGRGKHHGRVDKRLSTSGARVAGLYCLCLLSCYSLILSLTVSSPRWLNLQSKLSTNQLPIFSVEAQQPTAQTQIQQFAYPHDHDFCNTTTRCGSISLQHAKISFVHISKNGGTSWIRELKKLKQIPARPQYLMDEMAERFPITGLYPTKEYGPEHGIPFQDNLLKHAIPFYRFISLRSPRHHVWSMFSHCYYSEWGKVATTPSFPRNHPENDLLDFEHWLDHYLDDSKRNMLLVNPNISLGCYHPQNYQSRAFVLNQYKPQKNFGLFEPNWNKTINVYWELDWVGLTDFYHESKCLLLYRLDTKDSPPDLAQGIQSYLDTMCLCGKIEINEDNGKPLLDENVTHSNQGHRNTMLDIPSGILQKMDLVTNVDRALYGTALYQFLKEVVWMEIKLQRRVLCDPILDKWEKELGYLQIGLKETYQRLRHKAI